MSSIDEEWEQYIYLQNKDIFGNTNDRGIKSKDGPIVIPPPNINIDLDAPKCDELYISTKTKVLFLNQEIDINNIFWNIPIVEYWKPEAGVIKKQMKIISKDIEELKQLKEKLLSVYYYTENIIKQIDNPTARRIKFKDDNLYYYQ